MIDENQRNNRSYGGQYLLRVFLRIYFIILFITSVIGLSFSRQIGAILVFSLVSSLLVFICCNCGQCYKTHIINGHVLVGPPNLTLQQEQQIAYIIVAPSAPAISTTEDSVSSQLSPAVAPIYPMYAPNHFEPPPTYDESQRQCK